MLTSWFDIVNFADVETTWSPPPAPPPPLPAANGLRAVEVSKEVNSILKIRLYSSTSQREQLDQMFDSNRVVYNKLVARSRFDYAKLTLVEVGRKYRPIAQAKMVATYFRSNMTAARHRRDNDEVRDSALRDFLKAIKSSKSLFFALKKKDKKTAYPELKFKSKFTPSSFERAGSVQ